MVFGRVWSTICCQVVLWDARTLLRRYVTVGGVGDWVGTMGWLVALGGSWRWLVPPTFTLRSRDCPACRAEACHQPASHSFTTNNWEQLTTLLSLSSDKQLVLSRPASASQSTKSKKATVMMIHNIKTLVGPLSLAEQRGRKDLQMDCL